jgi:bifunctional DNA-binding transcriptional regulator/antitoxin component of YhaV-PrlF toxin-antitoxin module
MPALEKRKVLPIGEGGRAITLPKPFVDYHKIKPKDEVQILYDTILIVRPEGVKLSEEKEALLKQLLE